jgi:hypothetical protein
MPARKGKAKSARKLATTPQVDATDVKSQILTAIVREVGRIDSVAAGMYTKPDSFQNGQYGKYEKQDSSRAGSRINPAATVRAKVARRGGGG